MSESNVGSATAGAGTVAAAAGRGVAPAISGSVGALTISDFDDVSGVPSFGQDSTPAGYCVLHIGQAGTRGTQLTAHRAAC
jgi:hypothetical protein